MAAVLLQVPFILGQFPPGGRFVILLGRSLRQPLLDSKSLDGAKSPRPTPARGTRSIPTTWSLLRGWFLLRT